MEPERVNYGYQTRSNPAGPLLNQPHGYLRGRKQPYIGLTADDLGSREPSRLFSAILSPAEYQRRRTAKP